MRLGVALMALTALGAVAGCGRGDGSQSATSASDSVGVLEAINDARFTSLAAAEPAPGQDYSPVVVKLQVLLDRARFSPGPIDGQLNENTRRAIAAFERAHDLPVDGLLDREFWNLLTGADQEPVVQLYLVDPGDVAGPFTEYIPDGFQAMARLDSLGFRTPEESLAETFHMDERLLSALNPGVDFTQAGSSIVVVGRGADDLGVDVALVEVDRAAGQVRAYAADRSLLAVYPATVGSERRPAPAGSTAVGSVAPQPTYRYERDLAAFGRGLKMAPFEIAPGPNNPIGSVWVGLAMGEYGIHGTPEPRDVGKAISHGGVRMTNWDVRELARGLRPGVPVEFR